MKTLKLLKGQLTNIGRCIKYYLKFAWKLKPIYFFYVITSIVVQSAGPFVSIIGTKYLVNEIAYDGNRDLKKIIFWAAFICFGTLFYKVIQKITNEKQFDLNDGLFRTELETRLSMYAVKMKFQHTEDPKMLDMIQKAEKGLNESWGVQGIVNGIISIISNIVLLSGVVYLVVASSGWLLLPIGISLIISSISGMLIAKCRKAYFELYAEYDRKIDYYDNEAPLGRYAKDVRIYNAKDMLLKNQINITDECYYKAKAHLIKWWHCERADIIAKNACSAIIYCILGVDVLLKKINLGEFTSLVQATTKFSGAINGIIYGYFGMEYTSSVLKYYIDFMEAIDEYEWEEKKNAKKLLENFGKDVTIEFKNVSFKYPNTDLYVLKNVSTTIHSGEHLSIVGQNGTGKTTFIKLLCRLYDVTEGEILLNGQNIQDFEYKEYVKLLAVVFQDYRLLAFTIRDNISMGDENATDEELMKICQLSDMSDWVESTENRLDTIMYKQFDEKGIEPSGGQAQKLAIARALYKDAPVVILDEPTAALDPISEFEIYKHFDSLVGGKTAIYISHRLSSCQFCDRIIVFNEGTIIEDGTHDELVSIENGLYAEMYKTQAKHYL